MILPVVLPVALLHGRPLVTTSLKQLLQRPVSRVLVLTCTTGGLFACPGPKWPGKSGRFCKEMHAMPEVPAELARFIHGQETPILISGFCGTGRTSNSASMHLLVEPRRDWSDQCHATCRNTNDRSRRRHRRIVQERRRVDRAWRRNL